MSSCRACLKERMLSFLPLGTHPPANAFLTAEELERPEFAASLDTHVCLDCGLVQVPDRVPPEFFRNYLYVPSAAEATHVHFRRLAERVRSDTADGDHLLVDIGCNDGLFLSEAGTLGCRVLGIEPAANLAAMARARGVEVFNEYFGRDTALDVRERYGPAHTIVTTNTFNHIDDLHGFMSGVVTLLDERGTFVIEVPHALDYVEKNEFDTVYHEHVSTFTLKSLVDLFSHFGLVVSDVEPISIHGGSMRVFGRRAAVSQPGVAPGQWLARELEAGLFDPATYDAFRQRVEKLRLDLCALLNDLKQAGRRIAGYGAPAKGNTLLNYCGIGPDTLDFLADRNRLKHGLYSPGMHIPIVPAEEVLKQQPDYLLILAWNFADEIRLQQEEFRRRGGQFILPIPEPVVVS
ncbi:MAG TPA: class I SAM-dependent methyltransferase [Vicinamibacterales bacterium]|nr:class I SAM-dependent methyltransferase [Vicinamibacterales bacterium]